MTYAEALARSLEVNKELKCSSHFARPKKDHSKPHEHWDVEVVNSIDLVKQHESGKVHFDDKGY